MRAVSRLRGLFGFVVLLLSLHGLAQHFRPPDQNPVTLTSPSGHATLWINPSEPTGSGPSFCKVTVDGRVRWQGNLPFTFHEAGVSDKGEVGGYAYTEGEEGMGDFVVAIVDPTGKIVLQDRKKRKFSGFVDGPNVPRSRGLVFDSDNDRMIVRMDDPDLNRALESWWIYKLTTARKIGTVMPEGAKRNEGASIHQVKAVSGTPLLLENWYTFNGKMGQAFSLVDQEAKPVWSLDVPGDYESGAPEIDHFRLRDEVMEKGTILPSTERGSFAVRLVKKRQRVTYKVSRVGDKWSVVEVGRQPYTEPYATAAPLRTKMIRLPSIGKVTLPKTAKESSAVKDVGPFFFWHRNRVVYLSESDSPTLCVADLAGRVLTRVAIPGISRPKTWDPEKGTDEMFLARAGGSRFIVVSSSSGTNSNSRAWTVDAASGKTVGLPSFRGFWVRSVAAYPDGRFAVLSIESFSSYQRDHLTLYSAAGRRLWDYWKDGYSGAAGDWLSPEAIDIDTKGRIVVLDVIRHSLQFFDANSKFLKMVDLDKAWGRKASYPTQITCLPNGGFWLYDFKTERPCYLLDNRGRIQRNFMPYFSSGRKFETNEAVRVDPEGNAWVTNGVSIFRLDPKGLVVQTIGTGPRLEGLGDIRDLKVGLDGRIYALDLASSTVHVFDARGRGLFVATPKTKDFKDRPDWSRLEITRSGDIFVDGAVNGTLHFSPSGRRIGIVPYRMRRETAPEGPFSAKPTWRWFGDSLVNENEKPMAILRRWPDQTWMSGPDAEAPNGTLMAFEGGHVMDDVRAGARKLAFYDPHGRPLSQTLLPAGMPEAGSSAFDGVLCYFATDKGLIAVNRAGKAQWTYAPQGWNASWTVFCSHKGLALYDGERTVYWLGKAN